MLTIHQIKLVEDLLQITRQIRELWIVGPLKEAGDGEAKAEDMDQTVGNTLELLNTLRAQARQNLVHETGGVLEYISGPIGPAQGSGQGAGANSTNNADGQGNPN
jgi:hypothetical protein